MCQWQRYGAWEREGTKRPRLCIGEVNKKKKGNEARGDTGAILGQIRRKSGTTENGTENYSSQNNQNACNMHHR